MRFRDPSRFATWLMIHQSGSRLARRWQESDRWREIRRSELVTVPDFLAPGQCRQQRHVGIWSSGRCRLERTFSETTSSSHRLPSACARRASASGRLTRPDWCAMTQSALILRGDRSPRNRSEPPSVPVMASPCRGACQKRLHPCSSGRALRETHVSGELVGEAADLAPAHGIRLPGHAKTVRSAGLADAAGREMAR